MARKNQGKRGARKTPPPEEQKDEHPSEEKPIVAAQPEDQPTKSVEQTVVLKEVPPDNPPIVPEDEEWMIVVTMKNRKNAILHVAGLVNLIVSLEIVGVSACKDPEIAKNDRVKEIYTHNINEAQSVAMIHVTQLMAEHKIVWDEVMESMVKDFMKSIPPNLRGQVKEEDVRTQAMGIISAGYEITMRCRANSINRYLGEKNAVEPSTS